MAVVLPIDVVQDGCSDTRVGPTDDPASQGGESSVYIDLICLTDKVDKAQ